MKLDNSDVVINLQDAIASKGLKGKSNFVSGQSRDRTGHHPSLFGNKGREGALFKAREAEDKASLVADGVASLQISDNDNGESDQEFFGSLLQRMEERWNEELAADQPNVQAPQVESRSTLPGWGALDIESLLNAAGIEIQSDSPDTAGEMDVAAAKVVPERQTRSRMKGANGTEMDVSAVSFTKEHGALAEEKPAEEKSELAVTFRQTFAEVTETKARPAIDPRKEQPAPASVQALAQNGAEAMTANGFVPVRKQSGHLNEGVRETSAAKDQPVQPASARTLGVDKTQVVSSRSEAKAGVEEESSKDADQASERSKQVPFREQEAALPSSQILAGMAAKADAGPQTQVPTPYQQIAANIHKAAEAAAASNVTPGSPGDQIKTLRITLHPDVLGDVEVVIRRRGETLDVKLKPEKQGTAELLSTDSSELNQALDLLRLDSTNVVVTVDGSAFQNSTAKDERGQSPSFAQQGWGQQQRQREQQDTHSGNGQQPNQEMKHGGETVQVRRAQGPSVDSAERRAGGVYL